VNQNKKTGLKYSNRYKGMILFMLFGLLNANTVAFHVLLDDSIPTYEFGQPWDNMVEEEEEEDKIVFQSLCEQHYASSQILFYIGKCYRGSSMKYDFACQLELEIPTPPPRLV